MSSCERMAGRVCLWFRGPRNRTARAMGPGLRSAHKQISLPRRKCRRKWRRKRLRKWLRFFCVACQVWLVGCGLSGGVQHRLRLLGPSAHRGRKGRPHFCGLQFKPRDSSAWHAIPGGFVQTDRRASPIAQNTPIPTLCRAGCTLRSLGAGAERSGCPSG